jgi:glycosyltransferase involved in cell wall biosynthesis
MNPVFTILLPVVRPPDLLPFAVASVLGQAERRFELMIVCDGAPRETVAAARHLAATDDRIRVFDFPKGERHGEAHRHTALGEARGQNVCQIADDDLWLPNHLVEMGALLESVDFGNLAHVRVEVDGAMSSTCGDLSLDVMRRLMLTSKFNIFGPTSAGYRLDAYRSLPVGWSPAPADLWTDLAMWRKFLAAPGLRLGTRHAITSLHFAAQLRVGWSLDRRREEAAGYLDLMKTSAGRDDIRQRVLKGVIGILWGNRDEQAKLIDEVEILERRLMVLEAVGREKVAALEAEIQQLKGGPSSDPVLGSIPSLP